MVAYPDEYDYLTPAPESDHHWIQKVIIFTEIRMNLRLINKFEIVRF